jgi:hypothetical protein
MCLPRWGWIIQKRPLAGDSIDNNYEPERSITGVPGLNKSQALHHIDPLRLTCKTHAVLPALPSPTILYAHIYSSERLIEDPGTLVPITGLSQLGVSIAK